MLSWSGLVIGHADYLLGSYFLGFLRRLTLDFRLRNCLGRRPFEQAVTIFAVISMIGKVFHPSLLGPNVFAKHPRIVGCFGG